MRLPTFVAERERIVSRDGVPVHLVRPERIDRRTPRRIRWLGFLWPRKQKKEV